MKGVTAERKGDMYLLKFESYTTLLGYLNMSKPSQITICYDGKELTAAIPVQFYRVDI